MEDAARRALAATLGPDATFHPGQLEAILHAARPGGRLLVVQRTGWGKSLVYFIASRLHRDAGRGLTLIVSPLLALMRNQREMAMRLGLRAASIDSTNRDDWPDLHRSVKANNLDVLLVSPERLGNPEFAQDLLPTLEQTCGLLVIDEAHCISDWGHDFRPDYRRIVETVRRLPPTTSVLATTATANDRVVEDIREQLGEGLTISRGSLTRESLRLRVVALADQAERLAFLAKYVPRIPGTGIVYSLTVTDAQRVAEWLSANGIAAESYHADLTHEDRVSLETRFLNNEIKVLSATTALGMGYDKPDVAFVIHFQRPGSVIAYYQQIGRAGRALTRAEVVLLEGAEDDDIVEHFISSAFPGAEVVEEVREILAKKSLSSIDAITSHTNFRRAQVEKALKLMEVSGALRREGREYVFTNPDWHYSSLRSEEIMTARRSEAEHMREYGRLTTCRMEFLARALDDPEPRPCGQCDRCAALPEPKIPYELVLAAMKFLQRHVQRITPHAMYPAGFLAEGRKKIPESERLEPGVALSSYGDAGWGRFVREGKYRTGYYADELVPPSVDAVRGLGVHVDWVAWIPSLKHPELLPDFARRLAAALGVPAVECVIKAEDRQPQKEMQNSTRQFQNAWSAFAVDPQLVRTGTCLLVDDVIDSGWTLTAVGSRLRQAGVPAIVPFALATARSRGDA